MKKQYLFFLPILLTALGSCKKEPEPVVYNDYVEPYELVEETFRLGARSTAGFSNKSIITRSFTLPPRTVYWAYWMGAGPEPVSELAKVALPATAAALTDDPFVAYAWGLISAIPVVNAGTATADLFVLEPRQKDSFSFNNDDFRAFISKPQTKNVHDKYIDVLDTPMEPNRTVTIGLRNQSYTAGVDVKMKIWAFVVKPL
ncbi:MAG: hypothetical protein KJS92_08995 [Bacteroidetes bacterium]|nr:hypothetical protein [Bacteroidota bacterium]